MILGFKGSYRFLSNFYPCMITIEGYCFPSVENAYQAMKTIPMNGAMFEDITPGDAKMLGNTVGILRDDWEEVKVGIMEELLQKKFFDANLRALLLDTGDEELVEANNCGDTFWGVCNGEGQNKLGQLLMAIREELK